MVWKTTVGEFVIIDAGHRLPLPTLKVFFNGTQLQSAAKAQNAMIPDTDQRIVLVEFHQDR